MFKKGSGIQKKLSEALQDVNWGASSTTMNEIAEATYFMDDFKEIFSAIWKNLDASQKNWRVMFKAISLLEYLLKNGVATCVDECRDNIYYLRNLENFSVQDQGKERGQGVRDKVQVILAMVQDDETMQLERQKARRLKRKFAQTKSVGSTPAAPAAPAAPATPNAFTQGAQKAVSNMTSFFKKETPAAAGAAYSVKGGEIADIPAAGQVMKPQNATAAKLKSNITSFGQKVGGVMSSAASAVKKEVTQYTSTPAPTERAATPLRNFRDLEDDDEPEPSYEPQPEPEPQPAPTAAPKPAKPKVTRASKQAQALFNFGAATPAPAPVVEQTAEPEPEPQPQPQTNFFTQPEPAPEPEPVKTAPVDDMDFFSDIPSAPVQTQKPAASTDAFGGLLDFSSNSMQQAPQQQMNYQQQMYQQQVPQQQMNYQQMPQQQMNYQQQMYQQQMYQQQMYQQQMYQQQMYQQQMYQQQQQRGGYNMQGY